MRKLSLAICIILCVSVFFTGCSGTNKQSASNESTFTAKDSNQVSDNGSKIVEKDMELKVLMTDHQAQPLKTDTAALKEIYNKTGIKINLEAVPAANYPDKKRTLIATNNIPDIIQVSQQEIKDFAETGIFLKLSDYIDKYAPNFNKIISNNSDIKKLYIKDGLYSFPKMARYVNRMGRVPVIRTDLLKELNLNTPQSFDELYEVLKKFKEAYPDSYPMTTRGGSPNLLICTAYPMGSGYGMYYDKDIEGGKYVHGTSRPEFKKVLEYYNKLFTEKLLDPDFVVNTQQQWQEKLSTGKSFFYYDNPSFAINFNTALKANNSEYTFNPIPVMSNDTGDKRNFWYTQHWYETQYAISSRVKDPIAVIKLFDWLYSDEGADVTNFGVLGEHYTKTDGKYQVAANIVEKYKGASDQARAMMSDLGTGLLSFSTYIDERNQMPFIDEATLKWYDGFKKDEGMVEPVLDPPFTKEETERLKDLWSKVNTILDPEIDKLIMGVRPIGDFDELSKKTREAGVIEIEKIYNEANARVK